MIIQLWKTVRRGQEKAGIIAYDGGQLRVEGMSNPDGMLYDVFQGPVPEDAEAIEAALLDMPRRWDGGYLRAEVLMAESDSQLSYQKIASGDIGPRRYVWDADIRTTWGDELRQRVGLGAARANDTYGLFDGDELVGIASMNSDAGEPAPEWALVAYPHMASLSDKRMISFMATKRPGYGEELLTHLWQVAAETGDGIWLSSIWEAESFYEAVEGTHLTEGSKRFYWDVFQELTRNGIEALEPRHGGFADMPGEYWEGGPTSGWYAPPKGTHGPGSQGGDRYQIGITSYRDGDELEEVRREMGEFRDGLLLVAESVDVQLGTGGWEGGSEPTWLVQFRDGADALAHIAKTGRQHNQDAVLVMRFTSPEEGSPLVRFNFPSKLAEPQIRTVERGLVENGLGGWTWGKTARGTALWAACVPQWGGENEAHLAAMERLQEQLKAAGHDTTSSTMWVEVVVMERGEYGKWAG